MSTLVIGFGNTLRRDDGVGPAVACQVNDLGLPDVEVLVAHQLLPEHAEIVSHFQRVIFVDACADDGLEVVSVDPVEVPRDGQSVDPHACAPSSILGMSKWLFGATVEGWLVRMPCEDLGIGEGLSESARLMIPDALECIRARCG